MGGSDRRVAEATASALRVAGAAGLASSKSELLAWTNNVVVRLHPSDVVAKVGTWPHSREVLAREHAGARALADRGAPVGNPVAGTGVGFDELTGHTVTLWTWLEGDDAANDGPAAMARSLRHLHAAFDEIDAAGDAADLDIPDFRWGLDLARKTLEDDARMSSMAADDLAFLRRTFARLRSWVDDDLGPERLLHGEPHGNNVVVTGDGPQWIDFEAVCRGPLEYDFASVEPDIATAYGGLDLDLVGRLRLVNSARVAVWCWASSYEADMRWHAQHHLDVLRDAFPER